MAAVRVLVCGERLRGDDGAALLAAERLPEDVRAVAAIEEVGQLDVQSIAEVADDEALVVADAAVGVAPGEVVVRSLDEVAGGVTGGVIGRSTGRSTGGLPGGLPASSHALPPQQVLALAAELRGSLPRGVFVGIGAAEFGFGERLSPAVEANLSALTDALAAQIRRLARGDFE